MPPMVYQIRIKGHLGRPWTAWFGDLTITREDNGDTLLTGPVVDQAALHGLFKKLRDLGLLLRAIHYVGPADPRNASACLAARYRARWFPHIAHGDCSTLQESST